MLHIHSTSSATMDIIGRLAHRFGHRNVLAYSMNHSPPQPYRFKSSTMSLQAPVFVSVISDTAFVRNMRNTSTFKTIGRILFMLRTWTRRTISGDRVSYTSLL